MTADDQADTLNKTQPAAAQPAPSEQAPSAPAGEPAGAAAPAAGPTPEEQLAAAKKDLADAHDRYLRLAADIAARLKAALG